MASLNRKSEHSVIYAFLILNSVSGKKNFRRYPAAQSSLTNGLINADRMIWYLNPASVAFAEDTRHQARSRIIILQALYNAVDLVKEALPKDSVFLK